MHARIADLVCVVRPKEDVIHVSERGALRIDIQTAEIWKTYPWNGPSKIKIETRNFFLYVQKKKK